MLLVIKTIDNDGRFEALKRLVQTPWTWRVADHADQTAFAEALAQADAVVSMNWPATFPPAPRLRLIQLPGAGTDDIAFDAVPPGASVCNAYEHEIGISEYVLAAMLEWRIRIHRMDAELRTGRWWGSWLGGPAATHGEVFGRTLGIVGYGRIGREVARRAHAFGMRVIAVSRTPKPADEWTERVAGMNRFHELLGESDFVLSALPLDDRSRGLFDAAAFSAMRRDAVLINVGRGPTVDEQALFEACRDRRIGGAVIDTWYDYPPQSGHAVPTRQPSRLPFHELDNVVMTAHASAWTDALLERRCRIMAGNLDRLARGEPLVNLVRAPQNALAAT